MVKPAIIYGTAWKKERTVELVLNAWQAGFRAFDTACQPKHYREDLVGDALAAVIAMGTRREDFYLQTKYTPVTGQDAATIPYDVALPLAEQVAASFAVSQKNLRAGYVDGFILHSPLSTLDATLQAWGAMELICTNGMAIQLGISNCYDFAFFKELFSKAVVKPKILQNRFYAKTHFDKELRCFCLEQGIAYQSFWSLTANPHILEDATLFLLCRRFRKTPAQVFFRYLTQRNITPLSGTTDLQHMQEDLNIFDFELSEEELFAIDRLLV